jgi:hypothetical protein
VFANIRAAIGVGEIVGFIEQSGGLGHPGPNAEATDPSVVAKSRSPKSGDA